MHYICICRYRTTLTCCSISTSLRKELNKTRIVSQWKCNKLIVIVGQEVNVNIRQNTHEPLFLDQTERDLFVCKERAGGRRVTGAE